MITVLILCSAHPQWLSPPSPVPAVLSIGILCHLAGPLSTPFKKNYNQVRPLPGPGGASLAGESESLQTW